MTPFKTLGQLKTMLMGQGRQPNVGQTLRTFLDEALEGLRQNKSTEAESIFLERLTLLVTADDPNIRHLATEWVIQHAVRQQNLPEPIASQSRALIADLTDSWLAPLLLEGLNRTMDESVQAELITWLARLDYPDSESRLQTIDVLFQQFISAKTVPSGLNKALLQLDLAEGDVTSTALHRFPFSTYEQNQRVIQLLGETKRYRVIKPLISFSNEHPDYLRLIIKTLNQFEYDDVDQFYLRCLDLQYETDPVILIETIKQVRHRRLRKAMPMLDRIFPLDRAASPLLNRSVNGEIALTMASFGAYCWGREKLLPDMMLNGIQRKYLKAIDLLQLEEAVPLLKALLLMPETAELIVLQQEAHVVCTKLLHITHRKRVSETCFSEPI